MGAPGHVPATAIRVLLVEDDAVIAFSEEKELAELGCDVAYARNAEEALRYARDKGNGFDLVLMDVDLGKGMDGIAAAFELRKTCDARIVFFSSSPEQEIAARTRRLGSCCYFPKDQGIGKLCGKIAAKGCLGRRGEVSGPPSA
jgi:DNA-binding response OmpR family regulator